jgi:hypothetical protein
MYVELDCRVYNNIIYSVDSVVGKVGIRWTTKPPGGIPYIPYIIYYSIQQYSACQFGGIHPLYALAQQTSKSRLAGYSGRCRNIPLTLNIYIEDQHLFIL